MRSPRNVRPPHKTRLERGLVQPRATELTEGALWGPWAPLSPFSTLLQQLIGMKMTRCKPPICRFNDMYWKPHTLGMTHGCSPSLEGSSKFQTSQGYIERPCLKKKKKKERQKKGMKDGWMGVGTEGKTEMERPERKNDEKKA